MPFPQGKYTTVWQNKGYHMGCSSQGSSHFVYLKSFHLYNYMNTNPSLPTRKLKSRERLYYLLHTKTPNPAD